MLSVGQTASRCRIARVRSTEQSVIIQNSLPFANEQQTRARRSAKRDGSASAVSRPNRKSVQDCESAQRGAIRNHLNDSE